MRAQQMRYPSFFSARLTPLGWHGGTVHLDYSSRILQAPIIRAPAAKAASAVKFWTPRLQANMISRSHPP
jgi:hypothetical protein